VPSVCWPPPTREGRCLRAGKCGERDEQRVYTAAWVRLIKEEFRQKYSEALILLSQPETTAQPGAMQQRIASRYRAVYSAPAARAGICMCDMWRVHWGRYAVVVCWPSYIAAPARPGRDLNKQQTKMMCGRALWRVGGVGRPHQGVECLPRRAIRKAAESRQYARMARWRLPDAWKAGCRGWLSHTGGGEQAAVCETGGK
jgi:hypothetical protein